MDFKNFGADAEIVYTLTVEVNDELAIKLMAYSEESLMEQMGRIDPSIRQTLEEQFYSLERDIDEPEEE